MRSEYTAPIAEWDQVKGFGFLDFQGKRIFIHRRELDSPGTPTVGERVRFCLGQDSSGRVCAKSAISLKPRGGLAGFLSFNLLMALLFMPALAVRARGWDWRWVAGYAAILSLITYATYASDKQSARTRRWRVPEATLHLLEWLGGWPGAWIAQRRLRHKCSKKSFQIVFAGIVLIHQFAAYEAWQNSQLFRTVSRMVSGFVNDQMRPATKAEKRRLEMESLSRPSNRSM